jgi:5-methylcytosine-specific restriction enzyme A
MPTRFPKQCGRRGCSSLADGNTAYCQKHQRQAWQSSGRDTNASAAERGYGSDWRAIRGRVLARDKFTCQICGAHNANNVDHIRPKHLDGTDEESNLRTLCKDCHQVKSSSEGGRAARI